MTLQRNLIANGLGQLWAAAMGLAFTPLYVKYMGVEAYGLVGFFVTMQAWLIVLDMGLAPALNREMARFAAGVLPPSFIRELLRSVEGVMVFIACLVAIAIYVVSGWLASSWLQVSSMSPDSAANGIALSGCVIALRLVEGVYRSCLIGLQHQVSLNAVNAGMATFRWLGAAIVVALVSPQIEAFFLWQCLSSIISLGLLAYATYAALPSGAAGRFSLRPLREVWSFAGGVLGIAVLSLLLTQADKLILSRLLPLADFGEYSLAIMVASVVHVLVVPITQAWYPRFCQLYEYRDREALAKAYHLATQMLVAIVGSGAIVLIVFSETVLRIWTQNPILSQKIALLVSLLTLGNLLNALTSIPHQIQLAHGWPNLAVRINVVLILFLIPALLFVVPSFGVLGAAVIWIAANAAYLCVGVALMFSRILKDEKFEWYVRDILLPLVSGFVTAFSVKWLLSSCSTWMPPSVQLVIAAAFTALACMLVCSSLRDKVQRILRG